MPQPARVTVSARADSIFWEHVRAGRTVGPQDSFASAYGGLSHITIASSGLVEVTLVLLHADSVTWINDHLLLFDAGGTHDALTLARSG